MSLLQPGDRITVKENKVLGTPQNRATIREVYPTHYVAHIDGDLPEHDGPISHDGEILVDICPLAQYSAEKTAEHISNTYNPDHFAAFLRALARQLYKQADDEADELLCESTAECANHIEDAAACFEPPARPSDKLTDPRSLGDFQDPPHS